MSAITELSELSGEYVLDTAHTRIGFVASHAVGPQVRGHFEEFEGSARLDGADPARSTVRLTIRSESLQSHNKLRDNPVRAKFLDTRNHPDITFTSTEVRRIDDTHYEVTGDLTIRGTTKPLTLDVESTGGENDAQGDVTVGFKGSAVIDRRDWGVKANPVDTLFVGSRVTVEFEVAAVRRA
ncbi:polyisoprenoid-binding protein [Streptomyces venezuelae]|uniref:Polyisoprenoid-binding protein n=1 Tax=Streptomyces venezuelae TaxID=54571 RepID=A0A5P2CHX7_STRVZ|nr:YceI family protein [Streptomyces venezuelae]QES42462.1 polyisoprenoid-binding protein [Streptomyces venezuelae]